MTQLQPKSRSRWVSNRSSDRALLAHCSAWSLLTDLLVEVWLSTLGGHFLFWHFAAGLHYLFDPNRSFHLEPALFLLMHHRSSAAAATAHGAF